MELIKVKNLTLGYEGKEVVKNVTFDVDQGDYICVIGDNGSGKSTLMKAMISENLVSDYCTVSGKISRDNCHIGYLEQKLDSFWDDKQIEDYFVHDQFSKEIDVDKYAKINNFCMCLKNLGFDETLLENQIKIKDL